MATITATMLVGTAHQNHGGIGPTHQLLLSENSRPAWSLHALHSRRPLAVWTPTVRDMLEDGEGRGDRVREPGDLASAGHHFALVRQQCDRMANFDL